MLLLPPASAPDSAPLYHIAVETNVFRPLAHITVVRRWRVDGELIGSFECVFPFHAPWLAHIHAAGVLTRVRGRMGISTQRAVVSMRGAEKPLDAVLSRSGAGKKSAVSPLTRRTLASAALARTLVFGRGRLRSQSGAQMILSAQQKTQFFSF